MESRGKKKSSGLLAPGFRFHPTDEELVRYYLKRKVCGKAFRLDAISEIDIYKFEPWDLPSMSRLQTRDKEWYFFSVLDKKYGNGSKTNRATEKGYWKITGKDRAVYHRTEIVGMKKTHVYHSGRAPKGQRTNWVMHEYMLVDIELERIGIQQDAFVLCRIFQKSGSGPKNGEQYGAPFVEEEWEESELEIVPKGEAVEEVDFGDDVYLDGDDLEQILGSDIQIDTIPLHLNIHSADASYGDKNTASCESEHYDHNKIHYNLSTSFDMSVKVVKHEYIGESSNSRNCEDVDYLLDEPFLDSSDNLKFGDGGFMEANDLSNPIVPDASYLTFFDANAQYFAYDPAVLQGTEDLVSDETIDELLFPKKELNEGIEQVTVQSGKFNDIIENDAAFPFDEQELAKYQSDFQYPSIKHASQMLGSMPAPPVFAAEYPSKDMVLRLNSAAQNSSHVTAGLIQIERNLNMTDWSSGKHENFNIILSFGFVQRVDGSASLESSFSILQGKTISRISRDWLCFMLLWILILSVSIKIGTSIYAN